MTWEVKYSRSAKRTLDKTGKKAISNDAKEVMDSLYLDLEELGPTQQSWPNYSKLKGTKAGIDKRHCHLIKGSPTYVVCWEVKDKKNKILEVYYVGTHENAPY